VTAEHTAGPTIHPHDDYQIRPRGSLESEYEIYKAAAESMGWEVKDFDEWLNS
jgi:hypothetical protein